MRIKYKLIRVWDILKYELPNFVKNIWRFRKGLWAFRWYDPHGLYVMNHIAIKEMAFKLEKYGLEVDESRLKKVFKMKRASEIYKNFAEGNFIEQAEAEIGELIMHPFEFEPSKDYPDHFVLVDKETPEEKKHNKAVFERARQIEEEQWAELFTILKGQDYSKFKKRKSFDEQFDGSGLRGWWD